MLLVGVVAAVCVIVLLLGVVVLYKFRTFKKGPRIDGRGETIPNPAFEKGCSTVVQKEDANDNEKEDGDYLDVAPDPEEWV